ncbi:MAG: hypothetical protein IIC10_02735 [Proteobacteria bacterium]|nr:hypothetical protein [Pseudomonadota bacterium]
MLGKGAPDRCNTVPGEEFTMWTLNLLWFSPIQDVSRDISAIYRSCFSPVISLYSRLAHRAVATLLCLLAPIALASEHASMGTITNADGSASISIGAPHTFAAVFLDDDVYKSDYSSNRKSAILTAKSLW